MTATLTPRERELARHALGLPNKNGRTWGNIFLALEGREHCRAWQSLAERGLATSLRDENQKRIWFALTRAGALAALEEGEALDEGDFPR